MTDQETTPSSSEDTFDIAHFDSAITNAMIGLGSSATGDRLAASAVGVAKKLDYRQKETLFNTDAFCRAVCEVVPNKAVSGGWEITLGGSVKDPEKILNALSQYERKLAGVEGGEEETDDDIIASIGDCFRYAQIWANAKDGAAIVLNIDDGQHPSEPVRKDRIRTIKAAEVLDREQIQPVFETNYNPLRPRYYELLLPEINAEDRLKGMFEIRNGQRVRYAYYIHRSRVIRFDGLLTTMDAMRQNQGWGGSPLDLLWDELNRWRLTQNALANAVMDHSLFVHSIKGLKTLLASNDTKSRAALELRLRMLKTMSSVLGGVAIDSDGEKMEYMNRNFAGIADMMNQFRDALIGASRLPHTLLFGEAPSSALGATGDSEENAIASLVKEFQMNCWKAKLERLYRLIFLAKDGPTKGQPIEWNLKFNSLIPENEAEKIANRNTQAAIDNTYLSAGVLTKDEIRSSRFGGDEYSFETTLDEAEWKKLKDKENEDPFANLGDFGGGDQPQLPPAGGEQQPLDLGQATTVNQDSVDVTSDPYYHQAVMDTQKKFRVTNSRYAQRYLEKRYTELRKKRRSA